MAKLSRVRVSLCRTPIPGSRPSAASASRASDSANDRRKLSIALGGLTASRGDCVRGEVRLPNFLQWSRTRGKSACGYVIGSSCHAFQYAWAPSASHRRMSSEDGQTAPELLQAADRHLYQRKKAAHLQDMSAD